MRERWLGAGELVRVAVAAAEAALTPYVERDWTATPARDLDLSCRATLTHVVDGLHHFTCQVLTAHPESTGTAYELRPRPRASPATGGVRDPAGEDLLRGLTTYGGILAAVVEAADPASRAYHPYGAADPAGFATMGALEVVVHAYDIAAGFGGTWAPPAVVAWPCVDRLFHDQEAGLSAFSAADALLWCCGRVPLPGRPRRDEGWRWDGRPMADRLRGRVAVGS
ncbi:MAG: hypothetical protein M9891_12250 [Austwickia sp.]|nr:hypothetical protein [Actinomycetota bacterium]MCB1255352.1 hypothetical protein [Austwickia sp.]MCO5310041.1 hypothetical protein [Austwickia sp.]